MEYNSLMLCVHVSEGTLHDSQLSKLEFKVSPLRKTYNFGSTQCPQVLLQLLHPEVPAFYENGSSTYPSFALAEAGRHDMGDMQPVDRNWFASKGVQKKTGTNHCNKHMQALELLSA